MTLQKRPQTEAEKFFAAGVQEAQRCESALQRAREYMIHAGLLFRKAKESVNHGDWEQFIIAQQSCSVRAVQKYMAIANKALEWARKESPKLIGTALERYASTEVTLMSTVEVNALLRYLGFFRKFGEYDKSKYDTKRLNNGEQLELNFEKVFAGVRLIKELKSAGCVMTFPEGKDKEQALKELQAELQSALEVVASELEETIDV